MDPKPVLYYLLRHHHVDEAIWLLSKGAKANCLLRWEFMVQERLMTAKELLQLMERANIRLSTKSDDGFKFYILHYLCYFGEVEEVRRLSAYGEFQELAYNTTETNDIALTIALLTPEVDEERKVQLATLLYGTSNLAISNNNNQNPVQLVILMGRVGLLFRMLSHSNNVRSDRYHNTILHLAIKAGLITVARYILRYVNFGSIDQGDNMNDTVLTLAIKKGEEELACEIVKMNADVSNRCLDWNMSQSSNDHVLHQCLKRDMQDLSCEICAHAGGMLTKDTNGDLPLHIALNRKLDKVVNYLINHESKSLYINERNERDLDTPLHLALKLGYYNHSMALLQNGAGVSIVNREGLTPCHILMMVAKNDYQSIAKEHMSPEQIIALMQTMLSFNPDLEILSEPTAEGGKETCLHIAIRGGAATQSLALLCLQYRSELAKLRDSRGNTPLLLAVINQNYKLVCALCDVQSDLNVMNADRNTPLHIAVESQNYDIVLSLLFSHSPGESPRRSRVVSLLLERGGTLSDPHRRAEEERVHPLASLLHLPRQSPNAQWTNSLHDLLPERLVRLRVVSAEPGRRSLPSQQRSLLLPHAARHGDSPSRQPRRLRAHGEVDGHLRRPVQAGLLRRPQDDQRRRRDHSGLRHARRRHGGGASSAAHDVRHRRFASLTVFSL